MKREEIVGKRFLSVNNFVRLKPNKISEWGWRAGVIRASSHRDNKHPDLQVLVEYDDVEWYRREWISIYKDSLFQLFMVEDDILWSDRQDPYSPTTSNVIWPGLSFTALVDTLDSKLTLQPVEFLVDRELAFREYDRIQPFLGWDQKLPGYRDYPDVVSATRKWLEAQDGQRILLTTPSVLVGYRVEVYRAEGTTQWYTAVIVGYNEATRDLTVTDDTVLEEHSEDPCLVQMRLIGDGVVESIMRGEVVGITPRRSRSSAVLTQNQQQPSSRVSRINVTRQQANLVNNLTRKQKPGKPQPETSPTLDTCDKESYKSRRRKISEHSESTSDTVQKEDLENKGNKKRTNNRGAKKKVLEEANNSKLRHVEVRVEDCLRLHNLNLKKDEQEEEEEDKQDDDVSQEDRTSPLSESTEVEDVKEDKVTNTEVVKTEVVQEEVNTNSESDDPVQTSERTRSEDKCNNSGDEEKPASTVTTEHDDGPSSPLRMDDSAGTTILRFSDNQSDSGVSSLRSGSGDERSGSRSSALSSSDEPQTSQTTQPANRSPLFIPTSSSSSSSSSSPQVWRDPSLVAEPRVRHVQSVQHQTLLMSHPPPASAPQPPSSTASVSQSMALAQAQSAHYPPTAASLLNAHAHPMHHVPIAPPGLYQQLPEIYRQQARFPLHVSPAHLLGHHAQQQEEMMERERAYTDRFNSSRREQDARNLEKHHREREKMARDREKQERERKDEEEKRKTNEAVRQHFEESLRLAQQKKWGPNPNIINSLPPPPHHREEEMRKIAEEHGPAYLQQKMLADRSRERFYATASNNPPPAHSRPGNAKPLHSHTSLPKAEPNFNSFGYSGYPPMSHVHDKGRPDVKSHRPPDRELPNPPPLTSDLKNSVIVKNDGNVKGQQTHSPKMQTYLPPTSKPYEYRSPTQSPHHHIPQHHRPMARQSPDQRYMPSGYAANKAATVGSYPYPAPPTTAHYSLSPNSVASVSKTKVSSPAPHHIYGKPTAGITTGTPVYKQQDLGSAPLPLTSKTPLSTSPSPFQQMSTQNPPPSGIQVTSSSLPPPAHSTSRRFDYPAPGIMSGMAVKPPPQHLGTSPPLSAAAPRSSPSVQMASPSSVQTQPLDLGLCPERSGSPKRKATPIPSPDPSKKRRNESPQPVLSRVSEPSPLVAGAATTITTLVNTAAYPTDTSVTITPVPVPVRTGSADSAARPSSTGSSGVSSVFTPQSRTSPACSSPGLSTSTPSKLPPASADSEKSNSPGPVKTMAPKLKKRWLQKHSCDDGDADRGAVGSGSSITLPIARSIPPSINLPNAVNSINKTNNKSSTTTGSKNNRKPAKDNSSNVLNGHVDLTSKPAHMDETSSSDQETRKSPAKRKAKVKKKKKGGKKVEEVIKKKKVSTTPAASESSDSDKDTGSDKDSDRGNSNSSKEPKKRGRRPKGSKNDRDEEPRNKKSRGEPSAPTRDLKDPLRKPPISQLKKTGESFLQDGPCFEVSPKLGKCRECRWTPNQRSKNMPNIFCRFYFFRRLRYTKNGQLAIAGFSDPYNDASQDDLKLWLPSPDNPPTDLDEQMAKSLIIQLGDQFCDLLKQEKEALNVHLSDDKTIAWKRVVQGVREMCDVCETTLFNFHWACGKCGFVVCLDCYKSRKNGKIKHWAEQGRDRDDFLWLQCTNRQPHEQEKLMLTQIIAGDSLLKLGRKLHEVRAHLSIPQYCNCPLSKELKSNGVTKDLCAVKQELVNGEKKEDEKENSKIGTNGSSVKTEINKIAPVDAVDDKKKFESMYSSSSDCDSDKETTFFSTLRELLIRPSQKSNGSPPPSPINADKKIKKSKTDNLSELITTVIETSMLDAAEESAEQFNSSTAAQPLPAAHKMCTELNFFIRKAQERSTELLPPRVMTLAESRSLYPNVNHAWLCDGKLLRLNDPMCPNNYKIFQDQWIRGQPVLVLDVTKNLDMTLWHPDAFANDFGEDKNDLINCMTGKIVPNQPMKRFWEGFDHFSKRLKDERGVPMLLKLKDWPPGEDFAEMLPKRFSDLMKVLPLSEYTHRNGRLNLASRLPECFVRPDLGPKMYNAYGSALHPDKGTTNLHLDISDAVNVMVYVGIPKDGDNDEHIKEAFRAIDEAGCDILTRRRVREKGELPGALWHIYNAKDADKIRDLLNKVAVEKGARLQPNHDPIHDQSWYLDAPLRIRLYADYGVEGYAIVQCRGDAVFIPAGAPHQVRNLHNCIKIAEDFVSPENVSHCFHMTQEFRDLSDKHTNHEDKLQIKNIIYHAVKDSISVLTSEKDKIKEEPLSPAPVTVEIKKENDDS